MSGTVLRSELSVTHIYSAFHYRFPYDFTYKGERHIGWEFVYVESGKIKIQAGDDTYILKSGEMVCHMPMEFHRLEGYSDEASCTIFCFRCVGDCMKYFNKKILLLNQRQKLYMNDIGLNAGILFEPKDPIKISEDGQMEKAAEAEIRHEQYIKNTIELLILSLLSSSAVSRQKRVESFELAKARLTTAKDVEEYLKANYKNAVRLEQLCERFPYSLSSMKRIFKSETGYSIIDYLIRLRISEAARLLRNTNLPISEIAAQTGFNDTYHFSNTFRKRIGKSPSAYRKSAEGSDTKPI